MSFYRNIKPLVRAIPIEKRTPLHPYFTSQPASLIQAYISNYCKPGDVVLDMFGGSGTTIRECAIAGYKGIYVDLLPWCAFIARMACIPSTKVVGIEKAFARLQQAVEGEINALYRLSPAKAQQLPIPAEFPRVALPSSSDVDTLDQLFTPRNRVALNLLLKTINSEKHETHRDFLRFVFSGILARASITYWKDKAGKGGGDSSIFKVYRYWVPKEPDERNVWELFQIRFRRVLSLVRKNNEFANDQLEQTFLNVSATNLTKVIAKESVDYIYTDPPYGSHIPYLDLSTMYHALLGFRVNSETKREEAIEGGDEQKSIDDYISLLSRSFKEAFKVLRPERWMTVVFTHKDPVVFSRVIEVACAAGFSYVNAVAQDTRRPSFHKINNTVTVLKGQMMLNFQKPRKQVATAVGIRMKDAKTIILRTARQQIQSEGGVASFSNIVHSCYESLLSSGFITNFGRDIKSIETILDEHFKRTERERDLFYALPSDRGLAPLKAA